MASSRRKSRPIVLLVLLALVAWGQSARYRELWRVVDRNTGFAHMTRGVNMYTLYALRSCVTAKDLPVLRDMLCDKDRIIRMAVADVLVDLGEDGTRIVQVRRAEVRDASERMMLQDALDEPSHPEHRHILDYPLTPAERARIHGCR